MPVYLIVIFFRIICIEFQSESDFIGVWFGYVERKATSKYKKEKIISIPNFRPLSNFETQRRSNCRNSHAVRDWPTVTGHIGRASRCNIDRSGLTKIPRNSLILGSRS